MLIKFLKNWLFQILHVWTHSLFWKTACLAITLMKICCNETEHANSLEIDTHRRESCLHSFCPNAALWTRIINWPHEYQLYFKVKFFSIDHKPLLWTNCNFIRGLACVWRCTHLHQGLHKLGLNLQNGNHH